MSDTTSPEFRAGFVAILGRPNVGKSTLLNQLLGEKLAIVSPRPQTTRSRLLGVKHLPGAQIALVDTPGLHRSGQDGTLLNRFMLEETRATLPEVDVVLLVSDVKPLPEPAEDAAAQGQAGDAQPTQSPGTLRKRPRADKAAGPPSLINAGDRFIVEQLASAKQKVVLVLNKIDLIKDKRQVLPYIAEWSKLRDFAAIVPVSAQNGLGMEELLTELCTVLPLSPPLFPTDMLTDAPERALVAERVREQIFLATYREVPYATAVTIDSWEERNGPPHARSRHKKRRAVVIAATIHVEKPNQKKILIGEGGKTLREIGSAARKECEALLGCPVYLDLYVRVDPEWTEKPTGLRDMGYEPG